MKINFKFRLLDTERKKEQKIEQIISTKKEIKKLDTNLKTA